MAQALDDVAQLASSFQFQHKSLQLRAEGWDCRARAHSMAKACGLASKRAKQRTSSTYASHRECKRSLAPIRKLCPWIAYRPGPALSCQTTHTAAYDLTSAALTRHSTTSTASPLPLPAPPRPTPTAHMMPLTPLILPAAAGVAPAPAWHSSSRKPFTPARPDLAPLGPCADQINPWEILSRTGA